MNPPESEAPGQPFGRRAQFVAGLLVNQGSQKVNPLFSLWLKSLTPAPVGGRVRPRPLLRPCADRQPPALLFGDATVVCRRPKADPCDASSTGYDDALDIIHAWRWAYEVQLEFLNKPIRLDNVTCVYCGASSETSLPLTDEHVIGRRFVPKGSLASGWSLIARACQRCNGEKANLEDDISAITLLPDLGEEHEDANLAALAARKARGSISRRTKKIVADSYEKAQYHTR